MIDPARDLALKARLRTEALKRRAGLGAERRAQASHIAAGQALKLLGDVRDQVVAVFSPFRDEIDTTPLADLLWDAGAIVVLPVVIDRASPLLFRLWCAGDILESEGPFGIATPRADRAQLVPRALVVPMAAFDRQGHRIGYGGGYYDRTLASLRAVGEVRAFGLAFACQEVAEIPAESHDERLDGMITEEGIFICGG